MLKRIYIIIIRTRMVHIIGNKYNQTLIFSLFVVVSVTIVVFIYFEQHSNVWTIIPESLVFTRTSEAAPCPGLVTPLILTI